MKPKDFTGRVFGRLTPIRPTGERKNGYVVWLCRCICGNETKVSTVYLRSGHTRSCGCLKTDKARESCSNREGMRKAEDLSGRRFGSLVVIERCSYKKFNNWVWCCRCDCGEIINVRASALKSGNTKSCSCLQKESMRNAGIASALDLSGHRFGRLVAIEKTGERSGTNCKWLCRCDCGTVVNVSTKYLRDGSTRSCGCMKAPNILFYVMYSEKYNLYKFGVSKDPFKRKENIEKNVIEELELVVFFDSSYRFEQETISHFSSSHAQHPNQPNGREWFYPTQEVCTFVSSLVREYRPDAILA